jgi:hypothetical protein
MIVEACLNGARPPRYHPRLPVSATAVAVLRASTLQRPPD